VLLPSEPPKENRRRGKKAAHAPPDLTPETISHAFDSLHSGADHDGTATQIWEAYDGVLQGPLWAIVHQNAATHPPRYFLTNLDAPPNSTDLVAAISSLDNPAPELTASPGTSILDQYGSTGEDDWQRHMMLGIIAKASQLSDRTRLSSGAVTAASSAPLKGKNRPAQEGNAGSLLNAGRGRLVALGIVALLGLFLLAGLLIVRQIPALGQTDLIRISLFYHPPEDGTSLQTVTARASQVIFTRGDERYLDQMRSQGYRGAALQYFLANEASGPERALCADYLRTGNDSTGIAGDFCSALHGDEQNFLHNGKGERLYSTLNYQEGNATRTRYYYLMNPAAPAWRSYIAQRAQDNASSLPYSGLFLDNVDLTLRRGTDMERNSDGKVAEYSSARDYSSAVVGYLQEMRRLLPTTTIWANLTESNYEPAEILPLIPYLDGVMNEYFVTQEEGRTVGPNRWATQMTQADSVTAAGKSYLAVAQGTKSDVNRMRFALASYLMIAGPNTYFRYSDGEKYHEAWFYDEYQNRIGSPLGERYRVGDLWRRDFTCGSVTVDIERRSGDIQIQSSKPKCLVENVLMALPLRR
jgi:hypothetical protein